MKVKFSDLKVALCSFLMLLRSECNLPHHSLVTNGWGIMVHFYRPSSIGLLSNTRKQIITMKLPYIVLWHMLWRYKVCFLDRETWITIKYTIYQTYNIVTRVESVWVIGVCDEKMNHCVIYLAQYIFSKQDTWSHQSNWNLPSKTFVPVTSARVIEMKVGN